MKFRYLLLIAALLAVSCSRPEQYEGHPMLEELMSRLDSTDVYIARYEARLNESRKALKSLPADSRELFDAYLALGRRYSKFIADSSIVYYDKAAQLAKRIGFQGGYYQAQTVKAAILIHVGFFFEGSEILDAIPVDELSDDVRVSYYNARRGLYHDVYQGLNSKPDMRREYVAKYEASRDTLLSMLPSDSSNALRERERICARNGDFDEAIAINNRRYAELDPGDTQTRALILYDRYLIYFYYMRRPVDDHIECILESAILDIVNGNQDIGSLRYVENYLTAIGNLNAAKKVSDYYYSTMVKYGSRLRLIFGAEQTIHINEEYAARIAVQKRRIQTSLILIGILSLLLLYITIQAIQSRNKILSLNQELERSGKTAKGYVLGFFQLYSSYISRLLALRARINTNTRRGNTKYVLDLTDPSKDITNEELKEMYHNFDSAFLDIFPNFVKDFNALLRPECRIELKPTELLNTELRIFAIIKLGITDSAKISELLHCSIKTVYNKRSGINSKLLVPKADFAEELAKL